MNHFDLISILILLTVGILMIVAVFSMAELVAIELHDFIRERE